MNVRHARHPRQHLLPFVLAACATLAACSGSGEPKPATAATPAATTAAGTPLLLSPADIVVAKAGAIQPTVAVTGPLEPVLRSTVNARVAAVVDQVLVREGDHVQKGQPLVRQNGADLLAHLRQAEAGLLAAEVEYKLTEGMEKRKTELFQKQYISEIDWAAAKGDTDVKRSLVRVQEANVAIARKAVADAVVVAPITGIVSQRAVEPGTQVGPGQPLMTLVDLSNLELSASVPARDVPRIRVGNDVRFTVDGYGAREFSGKVARINPVADSSRSVRVYVRVPNADGALRGSMFAKGRVIPAATDTGDALLLPAGAVRDASGAAHVWAVRNGKLARVPVTIGGRDSGSNSVQVAGALQAGEQVVLTDLGARADGTPVTIDSPR